MSYITLCVCSIIAAGSINALALAQQVLPESALSACPLQVHWMAPFFSGGGYSSEATAYVQMLANRSAPVQVSIDQHGDSLNKRFLAGLPARTKSMLLAAYAKPMAPLQSLVVCHSEPGAWSAPVAAYPTSRCPPRGAGIAVGRTMFESDRLPAGWAKRLRYVDHVWVPTRWSAQIFEAWAAADGVRLQPRVLPEPVDMDEFHPGVPPAAQYADAIATDAQLAPAARRVRLLSVFKWEWRKGWDLLLQAYWGAFSTADPVILYILTAAYHNAADFHGYMHTHAREACSCNAVQARIEQQLSSALAHLAGHSQLPHTKEQAGTEHVQNDPLANVPRFSDDGDAVAYAVWLPALRAALASGDLHDLQLPAPREVWCFDFSTGPVPDQNLSTRVAQVPLPASLSIAHGLPRSAQVSVNIPLRPFANAPPVRLLERVPQDKLPGIFSGAHAFVLPSRGEGWGRPHVEAAAAGIPVIATNWSGPTAFLDESIGWPVAHRGLVRVPVGPFSSHYMASPDVSSLMLAMHTAVHNATARADKGAAARQRMQQRYSGPALYDELARLLAEACAPAMPRSLQLEEHEL